MPMRGELPPVGTRSYTRTSTRSLAIERALSQIAAVLVDRDLHAVAAFCAVGLLLTLNVVLRFPDFGAQVAALVVFP